MQGEDSCPPVCGDEGVSSVQKGEWSMEINRDVKYSKDHEWAKSEDGCVVVGLTDYAQRSLTDIVFVELPDVGKSVSCGGALCVVESVKSVSDVYSPVTGTVVAVNDELSVKPELINDDPYGRGWIVKIKASGIEGLDKLMDADAYEKFTV